MTVYFVGAGPGDPELLTLKAHKLLCRCPLVIYAGSLVPKTLLDAYDDTETRFVDSASLTLEQTTEMMLDAQQKNQDVCRLQSGDLSIYSSIGEQIACLQKHKVPIEIIPGVGSAAAMAAVFGLELTVPEVVQTLVLTRFSKNTPFPAEESLAHLAQTRSSLLIYLSVLYTKKIAEILAPHYGKDHPVAIGYKISYADQDTLLTTVEEMHQAIVKKGWKTTALILISPALKQSSQTRSKLYDPSFQHLFRNKKTKY